MPELTVLVCGGRNYSDVDFLCATLDRLHGQLGFTRLIHGAANGADRLAAQWGMSRGLLVEGFAANWKIYGKSAGIRRNKDMLEKGKPDFVVVFPGGRGTANMLYQTQVARQRGAKIGLVQIYQRKLISDIDNHGLGTLV